MRHSGPLALAALLVACAHPGGGAAEDRPDAAARLALPVAGEGWLLLEIPPGWTATPEEGEPPLPATLRLDPPAGHALLLLTPVLGPAAPSGGPASVDQARALVELARGKAAETSVETPPALRELGGGARGWYFEATDRELSTGGRVAGPDDYRSLVQGAAAVGSVTLAFTLLDDGEGPHRAVALEVIRRARHRPGPAAAERPAAAGRVEGSREAATATGRRGGSP